MLVIAVAGVLRGGRAEAGCQTYKVHLNTSDMTGLNGLILFELTSSATPANENDPPRVDFLHYAFDAKARNEVGTTGGPVGGDITLPDGWLYDTSWIYSKDSFYNAAMMAFDSLGTFIDFDVDLVQTTDSEVHPSEFAAYLTGESGLSSFVTGDPLGSNALFTLTEGDSCEEVVVFSPLRFAGPDSIILDAGSVTSVPEHPTTRRLSVLRLAPNPARAGVQIAFAAPPGEIHFRVYDVLGRVLHESSMVVAGGQSSFSWVGTDPQGRRVAPGVYFAQIRNQQQSIVRKFVVVQ